MDGGLLEASIGIGGQFSRWLKPTDFLPGSVVTFEMPSSGSKLFGVEILGHDEYTRKLLEDKASKKWNIFNLWNLIRFSYNTKMETKSQMG